MQTSIVNYKKVENDSDYFRFDAEFYLPAYLQYEKLIDSQKNDLLRNLADSSYKTFRRKKGIFEYIEISNIDLTTGEYCSEVLNSEHPPSRAKKVLNKNDVIMSTVRPNRNAVSIILDEKKDLVASTGFCKLTAKRINPKFLFVLFKTSIYRDLLVRFTTATMYPAVNEDDILNLRIPIFDSKFQAQIELIIDQFQSLINKSKYFYFEAEQTLLSELGLLDWKPKHRLYFIKNFSNTQKAERIDAEYFQPMYEEILNHSKDRVKMFRADEIFTFRRGDFIDTKYYTEQKTKRAYIRIKELSNSGSINSNEVIYLEDAFNDTSQNTLKENDIVMAIIGDTIGKSNLVLKEFVGSYFSNNTGRFRLRPEIKDFYDPFCLEALFHSIYIQSQIECAKAQTGQPKIADKEVKDISIPRLSLNKQKQIGDNIKKAIENKERSKRLLDIAKRGVEMAIEKSEKDAQEWIEAELKKINASAA